MRVLFVDDDEMLRRVLTRELTDMGWEVAAYADAETALSSLGARRPDAALVDLRLPGMDGQQLLRRIREHDPLLPVVFLTGHGGVPDAVTAMRAGAYDFLTKPVDLDPLDHALRRAVEHGELLRENERLRDLVVPHDSPTALVGSSTAIVELLRIVDLVAQADEHVLVTGEHGTGKELVARRIHERSPRSEHAFVVVNCGAIPDGLVESELFGHERGSFTGADRRRTGLFEAAHRGTLFLDELGELPITVQPKLLRAVQEGEVRKLGSERVERVDVRVVAATNRDLLDDVRERRFREDLYYRVATLLIEVPPLRRRRDDVEELVEHFLAAADDGAAPRPTGEALEMLRRHDWPGNVRELRNAVARLAALVDGPLIEAGDVERFVMGRERPTAGELPSLDLEELEQLAIVGALKRHGGNRKRAAGELGIAVKTLYNKCLRYGVDADAVAAEP